MFDSKRGITAEDLYQIRYTSDPQLSPDGSKLVYVRNRMDEERQYQSHLILSSWVDDRTLELTCGPVRDSHPRWSPDGSKLCFVSHRSGKAQIWLLELDESKPVPKQITDCPNGAIAPIWSPDGKQILFSSWMKPGDKYHSEPEKTEDLQSKKNTEKAIRVTKMKYKSDDFGFIYEKNRQLAIVQIETGEIRPLTTGDGDHTAGSWSPDGKWVAISANRSANPDVQHEIDIYLVPVDGGEWRKITQGNGIFGLPRFSQDGTKLSFVGNVTEKYLYAAMKKAWVADLTTGRLICVTSKCDIQVGDVTIGDVRSPGHPDPGCVWTKDGQGLLFLTSQLGKSGICHVTLDGQVSQVLGGERNVFGFTYHAEQDCLVAAISDPVVPGDLVYYDVVTGEETRLTDVNAEIFQDISLSSPEEILFVGAEDWEIQGWIMKPPHFEEGKKYPAVLQIHGGPHSMYGQTFFHEFQLLAAQGYVVLYTNPRGSHGYGERFVQACCGDYGGDDFRDLMAGAEFLCRLDYIDENRLGVTGGSYGGFMTNWIVGQTDRFKAAVTDRSICNWLSFYGVSDIGYYFSAEEIQANPFSNPEKMWHHSPLRLASQVKTPLLIMHGERDYRCPIEQAEQLFITLQHQGQAPVSFIRFPDANHEMSRSGDPCQRVLRLNYTVEWFNRYI